MLLPPHSHTSTKLDSVILQYVPHKKNRKFLNTPTLENIVSFESVFEAIVFLNII